MRMILLYDLSVTSKLESQIGAGSGLSPEKLNLFRLNDLVNLVLLMQKWIGLFFKKNLSFPSKLNWGSYSASVAETASEKIGTLILSIKFISSELALYLYKFTIRRHAWNTVAVSGLMLLTDTWICSINCRNVLYGTVGPPLAASLELLAHRQNVTSLSLFCRYYFGRCFKQDELIPLPGSCGRSNHYSNRLHDFCQYSQML